MAYSVPVALVPLLVVVLLVVVVCGVDGEVLGNPGGEFQLLVHLVQQQVVLLEHHPVAVRAVLREDLEACLMEGVPLRTLPES